MSYHVLEHASEGVDSKRRAFEPHLTRFRVFVINRKIERRFIGHHACGPVLFVSQVGVDEAAIFVTLVSVHFRFLLSNIRGFLPVRVFVCLSMLNSMKWFPSESVFNCKSPQQRSLCSFPGLIPNNVQLFIQWVFNRALGE